MAAFDAAAAAKDANAEAPPQSSDLVGKDLCWLGD